MNAHLLAQVGRDGIEAHAVGLLHAIAAAFAYLFVDHEALDGLGIFSAGAFAADLGHALLVVDHGGDAFFLGQLGEGSFEFGAIAQFGVGGEIYILIAGADPRSERWSGARLRLRVSW